MFGVLAAAEEVGVSAQLVRTARDEEAVKTSLLIGFPELAPGMLARRSTSRRVLWSGEPLPPPDESRLGRLLRPATPPVRLFDRLHSAVGRLGRRDATLAWRERAAITRDQLRNISSIRAAHGQFAEILVTTDRHRRTLASYGIEARVVDFGYHPAWAGPIVSPAEERDIQVLVLGHIHPRTRRERIIGSLGAALEPDVVLRVERASYGTERATLVKRARIVLDIPRIEGNYAGIRMVLASAAGAAYLSEPLSDSGRWVRGRDHRQAALPELPMLIREMLADEPGRRLMVEAGQELIRDELSMAACLGRLLGGLRQITWPDDPKGGEADCP